MKEERAILPANKQIVNIYNDVLGSAEHVEGKDKTHLYLKPTEIESLLRMRRIPTIEWAEMLTRLFSLQDLANHFRLSRKKAKG